jgi:hypothetical protein
MKSLPLRNAAACAAGSPLGALVCGALAGVAGTAAMDLLLFADYKRGAGSAGFRSWEFSSGVGDWESAPAPAQVGRRVVEGVFQRKLPDRRAALVNNITHWGYGVSAAAGYGLVAGSLPRARARYGIPFGGAVWAVSYVVLPAAGLYKPIWEYDWKTLGKDLGAHLLYGAGTAAVFGRLTPQRGRS